MAKTWDIESGMGKALGLVQAICRKVRQQGGTEDDLRRLLGEEGESVLEQFAKLIVDGQKEKVAGANTRLTFELAINYDQFLDQMIAVGRYDWTNSDITVENFPITGQGQLAVRAELFHFNRVMFSDQVLQELDRAGYRPATIEELLALGGQEPDLQRQFPIVALGSQWRRSRRHWSVPCLGEWRSLRGLDLFWFESGWFEVCPFLAVRK